MSVFSLSYTIVYFSINKSVIAYVQENPYNATFFAFLLCLFINILEIIYIVLLFCCKNNAQIIPVVDENPT